MLVAIRDVTENSGRTGPPRPSPLGCDHPYTYARTFMLNFWIKNVYKFVQTFIWVEFYGRLVVYIENYLIYEV